MPYNQVRSFEEWVTTWFDHPATTHEEYWNFSMRYVTYDTSERRELLYITQAFENAETVFAPFSNAQIGHALWKIIDNNFADCLRGLLNRRIPHAVRKRCVESFSVLYEQVFAPRCANYLGHMQRDTSHPDYNALNGVCYMWWDIMPVTGIFTGKTYVDDWFLEVLLKALALDSEPCQESALHGLAHFPDRGLYNRRPEIEQAVEAFLISHPHISPDLRDYAQRASYGGVL